MQKLLISCSFVLLFIVTHAQIIENPKFFTLPDFKYRFDKFTLKYKVGKFPILVAPKLQPFLNNNMSTSNNMPCFMPDITQVTPIPNYSNNMLGIIPVSIPNSQLKPFKNEGLGN